MRVLDQKETIEAIDQHGMRTLIYEFSNQLKAAEVIGRNFECEFDRKIERIVFSGVGGSGISGDFIRSYLSQDCPITISINRSYHLPGFVDDSTLVILSSYSGNTEECLCVFDEAFVRKAKLLVITSGGELEERAKMRGSPLIKLPGGLPPRTALGYLIIPILCVLAKLGFVNQGKLKEIQEAYELIDILSKNQYGTEIPIEKNKAKQIAFQCYKKIPAVYAGIDHFDVVALRWRSQFEENSKVLSFHNVFPEMNHNELEGWCSQAHSLRKNLIMILLRDQDDHASIQARMNLTRDLIRKEGVDVLEVFSEGKGLLARMLATVHLGDWVSLYLALLYQVDPTPIHSINYLKQELKKGTIR